MTLKASLRLNLSHHLPLSEFGQDPTDSHKQRDNSHCQGMVGWQGAMHQPRPGSHPLQEQCYSKEKEGRQTIEGEDYQGNSITAVAKKAESRE